MIETASHPELNNCEVPQVLGIVTSLEEETFLSGVVPDAVYDV